MSERTNTETGSSASGDPAGIGALGTGDPLASSDAQSLHDGGALESDGTQWGPRRPPKTDAADDSAAEQTGDDPGVNAPLAAGTAELDPAGEESPELAGGGRGDSADGSLGGISQGLPGGGASGASGGRGDAAR